MKSKQPELQKVIESLDKRNKEIKEKEKDLKSIQQTKMMFTDLKIVDLSDEEYKKRTDRQLLESFGD